MHKSKKVLSMLPAAESYPLKKSMSILGENSGGNGDGAKNTENPVSQKQERDKSQDLDPTRYGDWERNGRCIDF